MHMAGRPRPRHGRLSREPQMVASRGPRGVAASNLTEKESRRRVSGVGGDRFREQTFGRDLVFQFIAKDRQRSLRRVQERSYLARCGKTSETRFVIGLPRVNGGLLQKWQMLVGRKLDGQRHHGGRFVKS